MSTHVEESVDVNLPVSTVYNQWAQFEEFPQFMSGVASVTQLSDDRLEWVAEIAGVRRRWQAKVLEQIPERKVAWAATEGCHERWCGDVPGPGRAHSGAPVVGVRARRPGGEGR